MAESLTPVHLLKKYDTGDNPGAANLNSNLDTIERDLISWGAAFPSTFTLGKLFLKTDEGKFYQNTGTLLSPVWTFVAGSSGGAGVGWKAKVRVATAAAGTLATSFANGQTVDGVVLATGDRILIKDQADASENGIYEVQASGAPERAGDADTTELLDGAVVVVGLGTAGANSIWQQNTDDPVVDADDLVWAALGSGGATSWKAKVRVATTDPGTFATAFANGQTVDGVVLATDDRILIKDQADATQNGIYVVQAAGAPSRSTDADTTARLDGAVVVVGLGSVNANTVWQQNSDSPAVGADDIDWSEVGAGGAESWKAKVRVATNAAGTLATSFAAGQSVDGVVLAEGDRILIKDQLDNTQNGIYVVQSAGAPVRASDADTTARLDGAVVVVGTGGANLDSVWQQTVDNPVIGVDSILWTALGVAYDPMHDPSFWLLMG